MKLLICSGYLISIERGIHNTNEQVRKGIWQAFTVRTLAEKTAGVIGFGSIGKAISKDCNLLASKMFLGSISFSF